MKDAFNRKIRVGDFVYLSTNTRYTNVKLGIVTAINGGLFQLVSTPVNIEKTDFSKISRKWFHSSYRLVLAGHLPGELDYIATKLAAEANL